MRFIKITIIVVSNALLFGGIFFLFKNLNSQNISEQPKEVIDKSLSAGLNNTAVNQKTGDDATGQKKEDSQSTSSWPEVVRNAQKAVVSIKTPNSIGSGFFISRDGTIVTNSHVVSDNAEVDIILNSKQTSKAFIIKRGKNPLDIAILKLKDHYGDIEYLEFEEPANCAEGEDVIAIGSPLMLSNTVTKGIISNCNRSLKNELKDIRYIQTDTSVSPGNSGGPLLNGHGKVLGMLTWKIVKAGVEGLNFAISGNTIKAFKNGELDNVEQITNKISEENQKLSSHYAEKLKETWKNEYTIHYDKISKMVSSGLLSPTQGSEIIYRAAAPPSGYSSVGDWLNHLAAQVVVGETTENQAHVIVKNNFK